MFIKSPITGTAITAILVSVLAATRLIRTETAESDFVFYEIEDIQLLPEPEPPMDEDFEKELENEITPQAPIPAMDLIADTKMDSIALPLTTASFDPTLSVDLFAIDRDPADLPAKKAPPRVKTKVKIPVKSKKKWKKPPVSVKKVKSYYSPSELDRKPKELRRGSFTWPSSARGTSGTVKLILEISTTGRVTVLGVSSSTDSQLNSAAKRVAKYSRYTAPTYRGKPVKTKFYKTYHLKKPR